MKTTKNNQQPCRVSIKSCILRLNEEILRLVAKNRGSKDNFLLVNSLRNGVLKLTSSNKGVSGDRRLKVLLFLMLVLFVLDFSFSRLVFFEGNTGLNFNKQLSVANPNSWWLKNFKYRYLAGTQPCAGIHSFFFQSIPINMADKNMLMSVQGIGPAMADTIVTYRQQVGPFRKSTDL